MGNAHKRKRLNYQTIDNALPENQSAQPKPQKLIQPTKNYQTLSQADVPTMEPLPFRLEIEQPSSCYQCFPFFKPQSSPRLVIKPLNSSPKSRKR